MTGSIPFFQMFPQLTLSPLLRGQLTQAEVTAGQIDLSARSISFCLYTRDALSGEDRQALLESIRTAYGFTRAEIAASRATKPVSVRQTVPGGSSPGNSNGGRGSSSGNSGGLAIPATCADRLPALPATHGDRLLAHPAEIPVTLAAEKSRRIQKRSKMDAPPRTSPKKSSWDTRSKQKSFP